MTPGETPTPGQVRAAREAAGLLQREAAELIWVSETTWRQWESSASNKRQMPAVAWWAFHKRAAARRSKK